MRTIQFGFSIMFLLLAMSALHLQSPVLLSQTFSGQRFKFEHITVAQGLSQSSIHCMLQDRQGFMWFGTGDDLNKYDGYSFVTYKPDAADSTSISAGWVLYIYEDHNGTLWVGTFSGGLNQFNRENEQFIRYVNDPTDPQSLSDNKVNAICKDHTGTLWIGTEYGLNRLDPATKTFAHFLPDPLNPRSLSHPTVCAIYEDRSNALWIGTEGGGLNRFDPDTKQFTRFVHDSNDPQSLSDNIVRSIYEDHAGRLWFGTDRGGLNQFDRATQKFTCYAYDPNPDLPALFSKGKAGHELSHPEVRAICEDHPGKLWLGTLGGGLDYLDPETGQITYYVEDPNPALSSAQGIGGKSLSNNRIFSMCTDRFGTLWIGIDNGLNKLDRGQAPFTALINEIKNPPNSSHNIIWSICQDHLGALWIGTENGLFRWIRDDHGQQQVCYFIKDPNDPNSVTDNKINVIDEDSRGTVWLGTDSGLMQFDPEFASTKNNKQLVFRRWDDDAQSPGVRGRLQIFSICEDSTTRLNTPSENTHWIGTNGGLFRLIKDMRGKNHITVFKHDPENPHSISSDNIRPILVDRSGTLWVGTWGGGLNQFDRQSEQFTCLAHEGGNPHSLSNDIIRSIYEDHADRLWIGTNSGLDQFDRTTKQFRHYTEKDGLPNNTIWGILEDDHGRLWLSTNNGISRFDPSRPAGQTFKNYTVRDGLSHQEFNRGAWFKSKDGEMFFGGMNGVTVFHPDSIKDNSAIPPVVITACKRYDTDDAEGVAIAEKGISARQEIKLSYKDNIISFEFVALNFRNSEQNQYAYKLEGYLDQWIQLGTHREATFTNLDPGEYVLCVKGSNNDGVWNEESTSFKITITPPWWKTWWAYILYGVIFFGTLFGLWRYEMNRILWKNRVKMEYLESEKLR